MIRQYLIVATPKSSSYPKSLQEVNRNNTFQMEHRGPSVYSKPQTYSCPVDLRSSSDSQRIYGKDKIRSEVYCY